MDNSRFFLQWLILKCLPRKYIRRKKVSQFAVRILRSSDKYYHDAYFDRLIVFDVKLKVILTFQLYQ